MKSAIIVLFAIIGYVYCNGEGFATELNNLPFKALIGGPLTAVIQAQALSSKKTVDFIHQVGFTNNNGVDHQVRTVSFGYSKFENNTLVNYTLTVPFILMLPIPYIEIEEMTIDLNVKLNSLDKTENSQEHKSYAEISGSYGWWYSVSFKAGYSYQSNSKQTGETKREYSLNIHVEAAQAGLPKGTERILDILESVIREVPKDA
jgi:hypothetical protein